MSFSFVRYKPGEGATYVHRHKVQEEVFITLKGTGSIILDGKRISMPEGTIYVSVPQSIGPSATTQKGCGLYDFRSGSAKKIFAWRKNLAGWHSQPEESAALEKIDE